MNLRIIQIPIYLDFLGTYTDLGNHLEFPAIPRNFCERLGEQKYFSEHSPRRKTREHFRAYLLNINQAAEFHEQFAK